jgi:trans-aconitate 2-methyltransferase
LPWDPNQYLVFADERALPFHHLAAAVVHLRPRLVLDIGCGPGALTATLIERWPGAEIVGIDSSPEMIEIAQRRAITDRLHFVLADIRSWHPERPYDLIVSNACLHWIEDHASLLRRLVSMLSGGGVLAIQVPANHGQPSHTILDEICTSERWRRVLGDVRKIHVQSPEWYANELEDRGFRITAWQTTYLHRLQGDDPVLEWVKGTTLRQMLDRLDPEQREVFLAEYGARLRRAYPVRDGVTVFPFTRTFVIAARV